MSEQSYITGPHRADIMAEVRKKGSTLAGVGRRAGLSRATMSWALMKPHPRANAAIAEFLGRSLHELWPQWFDLTGTRISIAPEHAPAGRRESSQGLKSQRIAKQAA